MTDSTVTAEPFTIRAADGYSLAATRFVDERPPTATIIVAGATGVQQRFYRRFAEFAASDCYEVVTLDYRGIGGSAPPTLRGFEMSYSDWATLDIAAAIDATPRDRPLFLVGHSYGGVAFGIVPNIAKIDAVYAFGAGAAWHGWMAPLEALRVLALWHIVGPIATTALGYLPGSFAGLGSDMPLGVYRSWKRWSGFRHFFFDDPRMASVARDAARVSLPVVAVNATDDAWALPRSRDALMSEYHSIELTSVDVDPRDRGLDSIGHVGYFRPASVSLWNDALDWLDAHRERLLASR
jgi:predicted alpha/beta hydrolase